MKVTSIKTIRLTEMELKEAIVHYVAETDMALADHVASNLISCDFDLDGHLVISVDGEIEDERDEN